MDTASGDKSYYIRIRGRVHGPFTIKQLNSLRTRGQFSQSNEVSNDGQAWQSAAVLEELFGASASKSRKKTEAENEDDSGEGSAPAKTSGDGKWHYSVDGQQLGPVELSELQEMMCDGRIDLSSLIWKIGMPEWIPASEVQELSNLVPRPKRPRKSQSTDAEESEFDENVAELPSHFFDHVLYGLRAAFDRSASTFLFNLSIELGRYAVYFALIVNLAFFCFISLKLKSASFAILGVSYVVCGLALQFAAIKSCGAINRHVRNTRLRMSSTSLLDSICLISVSWGLSWLFIGGAGSVDMKMIWPLLAGLLLFLVATIFGLCMLHPEELGIVITDKATPGEEAIATFSFIVLLPLRFVTMAFAGGTIVSLIGTLTFFYLISTTEKLDVMDGVMQWAFVPSQITVFCEAVPLFAYIYFLMVYVVIDVVRSIQATPIKLEEIQKAD